MIEDAQDRYAVRPDKEGDRRLPFETDCAQTWPHMVEAAATLRKRLEFLAIVDDLIDVSAGDPVTAKSAR